jgi:PhnB protein
MSAPPRSTVATFVSVPGAIRVVEFAEAVFEATRRRPALFHADGRLWNVELDIGGSTVMVGDGGAAFNRPAFLYVGVRDVDATFALALEAGATAIMPPGERFYGARDGGVEDMAGNWWWIATWGEEPDDGELLRRARAEEAARKAAG